MKFDLATDLAILRKYLLRFRALVGTSNWNKRLAQLRRDQQRSPAQAKIVSDYHWLEMVIDSLLSDAEDMGQAIQMVDPDQIDAMQFAATVVEVHERLLPHGQATLSGRLRSALMAETGFAALYLEMDMARRCLATGSNVDFPDLESTGQYDLAFTNERTSGEIECKSLSADAGRKIHRKDFYRFMESVQSNLVARAEAGASDIYLITLHDRFPSNLAKQKLLRDALTSAANYPTGSVEGNYFSISKENYHSKIGDTLSKSTSEFYSACRDLFGHDIHISGPLTEKGVCLVVMRSLLEDDTSKPWLEAMEKASSQFSGIRPAFISVQFNDLHPSELLLPNFRRRAEILSGAVFRRPDARHVVGTFLCPYRGMVSLKDGVAAPAFAILNPFARFRNRVADYGFLQD